MVSRMKRPPFWLFLPSNTKCDYNLLLAFGDQVKCLLLRRPYRKHKQLNIRGIRVSGLSEKWSDSVLNQSFISKCSLTTAYLNTLRSFDLRPNFDYHLQCDHRKPLSLWQAITYRRFSRISAQLKAAAHSRQLLQVGEHLALGAWSSVVDKFLSNTLTHTHTTPHTRTPTAALHALAIYTLQCTPDNRSSVKTYTFIVWSCSKQRRKRCCFTFFIFFIKNAF